MRPLFFVLGGLLVLVGTVAAAAGLLYVLWESGAWDKLILTDSLRRDADADRAADETRARIVGQAGTAVTPLRPSGVAEIGGERLEVTTEGAFVAAGSRLRVVAIDRRRTIVRLDDARLDRHPRQLSGGERQRVGLMRALVLDPTLLLLDEPLGALDPIVRASLQADLKNVFEKLGKSVLVVTHDMAEAAYLAGTIAVMRDGAVLQRGTLKELVETPAHPFVAEFLGAQRSLTEALR